MQRRDLLKFAASTGMALSMDSVASAFGSHIPIVDSHIHLFDTARPGGVPWPEKSDTILYRPALPDRYARIAMPFGVVGAIAIEASPIPSDNIWLLQVAEAHPIIVGVVGNLVPGAVSFRMELEKLRANPLFVGIRYGNLWNRDLALDIKKHGFLTDLNILAQFGLELDTANPDPSLIRAIVDVSDHIPDLRIVIDHLPSAPLPTDASALKEYRSHLRHLGSNPHVFVKLSEVPIRSGQTVLRDPIAYKERLDAIWDVFGEDRILFGSDWPNSDDVAPFADTLAIVRDYVARKGLAACQNFFWRNSLAAYHWHPRVADQYLR